MSRKNQMPPNSKNSSKKLLFGEEDESEPGIYFSQNSLFRPDSKEMSGLTSASPSQLSAAFSGLYGPPQPSSGMSSIIQPRGMSNAPFQRNNVTPTNMTQNFPMSLRQQASPNRNVFSMGQRGILSQIQTSQAISSQINRPNSLASGIMSSQFNASSAGLGGFPRATREDSLDLSEFPTLGNRSTTLPNPIPTPRNYVGMVSKPAQEPAPEFQIQQEEFPALPSAQIIPPTSATSDSSRKSPTTSPSLGSHENLLSRDGARFPGDKSGNNNNRRGIQTHSDGTVSNIPNGMVTDQFGMVGLLTFIRAAESDPNMVALAPGIDLTTLGLNLNSPENLYTTFQSPFADAPCRPQDIDFHVPQEYVTNIFIREKLAPIKLNRYGDDLLFFLFYMNGGDVLQLAAAAELYNRDWRYHKEERVWVTRVAGLEPQMKTTSFERGTYYFFDAQNWRKVPKEFKLEYDKLEEKPQLPITFHHNPNQPTVMAH